MGNQTTKSPFDVQILAARLKDLMRESVPKVTQKDLAATLGTAPNMVSAYMHGKSCPSLPMAVNIAQYFDVSIGLSRRLDRPSAAASNRVSTNTATEARA